MVRTSLAVLLAVVCARDVMAAKPSFIPLGNVTPTDLSADGRVLVGDAPYSAFRWTRDEGFVDIPVLDSPTGSYSLATSGDGSITIGYAVNVGQESFRWTESSSSVRTDFTRPREISVDGSTILGDEFGKPYRWSQESGMEFLWEDPPTAQIRGVAYAISADNSTIVGGQENRPFGWTESTGRVDLGVPAGETKALTAIDVSSDGSILLIQALGRRPGPSYLWTEASGFEAITSGPDYFAQGMSDDGKFVVGSLDGDAAFWRAGRGWSSIEETLVNAGLGDQVEGWRLWGATHVSADGRVIVGTGQDPTGENAAWMVTVPEPSSVVLLAVAVGASAITLRRRNRSAHATA